MKSHYHEAAGSTEHASRQHKRGKAGSSAAPPAAEELPAAALPAEPVSAPVPPPPAPQPPPVLQPSAPAAVSPVPQPPPPPRPLGRRTFPPPILVATADPSLSRMLGFALNQMRLPFRTLDSGSVALRELLSMNIGSQPPLVVLDVDLPGVDGHAILERIGVSRPDSFLIVVLSSHADESVQVRSLLAGAIDHLAKPFNVRLLMAKIQRWTTMAARLTGSA